VHGGEDGKRCPHAYSLCFAHRGGSALERVRCGPGGDQNRRLNWRGSSRDRFGQSVPAENTELQVAIGKGLGTKARIDALQAGTIDIALASHGLKVDDLTRAGMVVTEIARTPVVFAVNSSVTIPSLTYDQVCAIYQGERTNWKEFGGPDLAIAPRTRPDTEVDAEVARDQVACLKSLKMPESVKIMQRGGDMAQELAATPGAFGMTTATVVEQSGGKVKALALGGITPDETNVTAGKYTLVREAFFVTKAKHSNAVADFVTFVRGPEGAAVIKASGAIPTSTR
jgi:phosphate transport system substrate-binding protein